MVRIKNQLDWLTHIISLLGISLAYIYLDLPAQIILPVAIIAGIWCDRRRHYLIGRHPATLLSIAAFLFYVIQIDGQNLVDPVMNTVALLMAVRLLTEKEGRDYLQIFMLASFSLAGSTLYTLSLAFLPVLVAMLVCLICGLVLLAFHSSDLNLQLNQKQYQLLARTTLLMPIASLILMLLFFLILPRTEHAFWDFLNPGSQSKSALSEQVKPGAFASTAGDNTVVFRVEMEEISPANLYWRVLTLDKIDGSVWAKSGYPSTSRPVLSGGKKIEQNIFPNHFSGRFVPTLDIPESITRLRYRWKQDGSARMYRSYKKPKQYQVISRIGSTFAGKHPDPDLLLVLPEQLAPEARNTTGSLIRQEMSRLERIAAIEAFFIRQQLSYATDNLPTEGDPVDSFLFSFKRGYCEYFASAFAVMLRQAGIPSRLVGGYLGGEYNPFAEYYAVTERMAHVWVEALLEDGSWMRLDPSRFAINAESALITSRTGRALGFNLLVDSIDHFWNQAIITFDLRRQFGALKDIREQVRSIRKKEYDFKPLAGPVTGLVIVVGTLFLWLRRRAITPEKKLLENFITTVRQKYKLDEIPASTTLADIVKKCDSNNCRQFVQHYAASIYKDRKFDKTDIEELRRLIRLIKTE